MNDSVRIPQSLFSPPGPIAVQVHPLMSGVGVAVMFNDRLHVSKELWKEIMARSGEELRRFLEGVKLIDIGKYSSTSPGKIVFEQRATPRDNFDDLKWRFLVRGECRLI